MTDITEPERPAASDRPGRRARLPDARSMIVWVLVAGAVLLPLRTLLRYQGPPMEEGFMLVFPELVLDGRVPHRDFLHLYGPGSLWALAGWYAITGVTLTAERLFGLLQLVGIIAMMMVLVRPWGRRIQLVSGLLGVLLTLTAIGLTALAWNGAVALTLAALWAGLRGRRLHDHLDEHQDHGKFGDGSLTRARRWMLGAGLLGGIAVLFRPDIVVALGAGSLVVTAGLAWRERLRWIAGAAIGVAPYLVLIAMAGFGTAFEGLVTDPVFNLRGGRTLPRPPSWSSLDGALQKVAALREPPWPVPALGSSQQTFVWFFLLPVVVLLIVGVGWWGLRKSEDRGRARIILAIGVMSLGMMPQALQRPDSTHLAWVSCVPLVFLPAAISQLLRMTTSWRPGRISTVSAAGLLLVPLFVIPHFTVRVYKDLVEQTVDGEVFGWPLRHDGRTFYLGSPEIAEAGQRMLDEITPEMTAGERLFVGTADLRRTPYSDAYLYHLLPDLVPATRYIEMDPGMANAEDSGMAEELANADWVILSHIWDGWAEPNDSLLYGPNEPNEIVEELFCPVGSYGATQANPYFLVYRRCR